MKIIINQPRASYFVGGAEMISFDHAINFLKLGHEVAFITISPKSIYKDYSLQFKKFYKNYKEQINIVEIKQNKKIQYIYDIEPGEDRCRWNIESIFYNQQLYEYLIDKNEKYDIVFSYYNLDSVFLPHNLIKNNVLYLCGIPKEQNDFQGSFLSAYDQIIAISEEVKNSWKKYFNKKIKVISTGVDCKRFVIKQKTESNKVTLLYIGRLITRKNVDKIIYSFNKLSTVYNVSLIIVGTGPDKERLESIANKNVSFVGVVDNPEYYYNKSDIFISPSEYGEGLQGTILEAMSCGLTIIATYSNINKKLLKDGRGILVEPNIDSIIDGIKKAIKIDRKKIKKKNRQYMIDNYDWEKKAKEILEVLK